MSAETALDYAHQNRDRFVEELKELLSIPSISTLPERAEDCRRAAEWLREHLDHIGLEAEVIEGDGHPLVYGEWLEAPGAPTVLVYGHYDVQPVDPLELWRTPPFEPTVANGDIIARGASDDKGQTMTLVNAAECLLRATGRLPVNVKFLIEGEEEHGAHVIEVYTKEHGDRLRADFVQIADSGMFAPGVPTVLTIHDLAFLVVPDCAYPTLRVYLERVVPASARRADRIIAVSENTRQDIIRLLGIEPGKVTTIHEGVSEAFRPAKDRDEARNRAGIGERYLLSVGTLEPRKNYVRLLRAYAQFRATGGTQRLVIVGQRGWLYDPIFAALDELQLADSVTILAPDDVRLVALYQAADAFIYPSLYEGFGQPPPAAMACGTPCACSSSSARLEVVGDAAITFDPTDVEFMASCLWAVLISTNQARLRAAGPTKASNFTWKRAAEQTVSVYRELLDAA